MKPALRAYLWGLVGAMLVLGFLYVINVFVPLGAGLGKAVATLGIVFAAWAWGLLGLLLVGLPPLRPAGIVGMAAGLMGILLFTVDLWDLAPEGWWDNIPWGLVQLQLFLALGYAALDHLLKGRNLVGGGITMLFCLFAGLAMMLKTLDFGLDSRLQDSLVNPTWTLCLGAALFYLPGAGLVATARWTAYAGFLLWATTAAVIPWVQADVVERLAVAGVALAILLSLCAITIYLIGRSRQPPMARHARPL